MSGEVEVIVTLPEAEVEVETVEIPAPIIITPDDSADQAELISLREFKQEVEQARLDEIEALALEAKTLAEIALEAPLIAEPGAPARLGPCTTALQHDAGGDGK